MEGKEQSKNKIDPNYFKIPPIKWTVLVSFGVVYFGLVCFLPDVVPYQYLGPLGDLTVYLQTHHKKQLINGFKILVGIHSFEAMFAVNICRRLQLSLLSSVMWTLQTFLFGFPSLGILLTYSKKHKKAKSS